MFKAKGIIEEVYPEEVMRHHNTRLQSCRFLVARQDGGRPHEIYMHAYNDFIDSLRLPQWIGVSVEVTFFIKAKIYTTHKQRRVWYNNVIINQINAL